MRGGKKKKKRKPTQGSENLDGPGKKPWECFLPAARAGGTCRVETVEQILPTLASHRKKTFYNSCERNLKCSFSAASLLMLSTDTRYSVLTELKANRKIIPPPAAGPRLKWKLRPDIGWVVVPRSSRRGKICQWEERGGRCRCDYVHVRTSKGCYFLLRSPRVKTKAPRPAWRSADPSASGLRSANTSSRCEGMLKSARIPAMFPFPSPSRHAGLWRENVPRWLRRDKSPARRQKGQRAQGRKTAPGPEWTPNMTCGLRGYNAPRGCWCWKYGGRDPPKPKRPVLITHNTSINLRGRACLNHRKYNVH